ncbi:hypothetical protein A9Q84_03530 [Halobacteriovorax marinus]|uniref:Uncharacterized protein n=1 Tax=Halobacteriovorax marinus TaxID=97084 RepID=A0A1Y5FE87_9BACT|nr:hypothetical protein A9Q84_03530 [Halobacteriovorax marinus]
MRVFSTFDSRPADNDTSKKRVTHKNGKPKKVKKSYRPPREKLSAEEIRAKVAAKTAKPEKKVVVKTGKQISTYMSLDNPAPRVDIRTKTETAKAAKGEDVSKEKKDIMLHSDIAKNDPTNTNTQEKLRGLLSAGGFGWNDKERAALQEILGKG